MIDGATAAGGAVVGQTSSNGPTPAAPAGEGAFDVSAARAEAAKVLAAKETLDGGESADTPDADTSGEAKPEPKSTPDKPKPEGSEDELTKNWVRLRAQEQRFKDRIAKERGEFNKEREAFNTEKAAYDKFKASMERAKKEPLSALKELGWGFEDLVDYVNKNGQIPQDRILRDMQLQMDEKMKAQQERLDAMEKQEKEKARETKVGNFKNAVVQEYQALLDEFPSLKKYAAKQGHEKVLGRIFWKMETEAKSKNYLTPSKVMGMFDQELSDVFSAYAEETPSPGGAGSRPANLEAAKPVPRPEPLSNDDGSERGHVSDDDDPAERRRRAKAMLTG